MRSARGRLLVGLIALIVLGMAVIDAAALFVLNGYATDRVDRALVEIERGLPTAAGHVVTIDGVALIQQMPAGFMVVFVGADGRVLERSHPVSLTGEPVTGPPVPDPVPAGWAVEPVTLSSSDTRFRVRTFDLGDHADITLPGRTTPTRFRYAVVGGSLEPGTEAVDQLLVFELIATGAAVLGVVAFGGIVINRVLREQRNADKHLKEFVAAASHELRTPLTTIRGWAELQRVSGKPELAGLALSRIEQEADRMSHLVDQLLQLASVAERPTEPVRRDPVDLRGIAAETLADATVLDPGRPVELDAPDEVTVAGDETELRQVVRNLVGNALKHTPPGTPIKVTVRGGGQAVLTVADQGAGMSPEVAARVFDRFYRAGGRTSAGGTGLGLSIVRALVKAHGGDVSVRSDPGHGSTFTVSLPSPSPPSAVRQTTDSNESGSAGSLGGRH
jgi:two-component system OmpR family sensor kinase